MSDIKCSIRPLHDKIVVEKIEEESKSPGGIIIPDSAKEKPSRGKIVAIGNGARDESGKVVPLDVKIGQIILFAKYGGTEINLNGVEYLIIKERDILGIIEG